MNLEARPAQRFRAPSGVKEPPTWVALGSAGSTEDLVKQAVEHEHKGYGAVVEL